MDQDLGEAAYVLKKYSLGTSRHDLADLSCHVLNRGGFGTSSHHCKRLSVKLWGDANTRGEGVQPWIYKRCLAIEPDPSRATEHAEHTNLYVAKQQGMLSPVRSLPGVLQKTHFWHTCWTGKHGVGDIRPNMDDPETKIIMEQGVMVEKLRWQAVRDHPKGVKLFMDADNLDAAFSLVQTEAHLLRRYHLSLRIVICEPSQTLFDAVCKDVGSGNKWSHEDKLAVFNLAKVLGEPQIQLIADAYHQFVDPTIFYIATAAMGLVSKCTLRAVWAQCCFVVDLICSTPKQLVKEGMKYRGNSVGETSLKLLTELDLSTIEDELLLFDCLTRFPFGIVGQLCRVFRV